MRVTAGKYKGRILAKNPYDHIRPTADVVKQAMFNKLAFNMEGGGVRVLDLFCGTGSLGIEALSRGAEVVFVDKDTRSANLTKTNLKNLSANAIVIRASFDQALKKLSGQQFDIIFLDPPYKSGFYTKVLELIKEYNVLSKDGVVVCEHEDKYDFDKAGYTLLSTKKYGSKSVTYLTLPQL